MGRFNFEDYRQPWETGPHWELKKEFIETYQDTFEEDRLLCLAQAYANVVLMNCCYPDPVMRQIAELSKPLQMRKKFQNTNSSSETNTSNNEQSRVSEKMKSIYGQTGRPFKQVKFCASKEEYNSEFSSTSTNLSQHLSAELSTKSSSLLGQQDISHKSPLANSVEKDSISVINHQNTETVSFKNTAFSYDDLQKVHVNAVLNNKSKKFSDKENDEKIISALGLSFIQNLVKEITTYKAKIEHPVGLIHCVIEKLGLEKDYSFEVVDNPTPKNDEKFTAKLFIKKCEITSGTSRNKKDAKKLAAQTAIDTFYKLSLLQTTSSICDKTKEMAAKIGIEKLANLSDCEIQDGELKAKYYNDEIKNVEKPPFILNQKMFNLSMRDGFVLVEKQNTTGMIKNEKTILHESASFNHKTCHFEFEDVPGTTSKRAILIIGGAVVGTGIGSTKEEAKSMACTQTLNDFKKKYYTLRIKDEYVEGFIITRSQVFDGESFSSNVISESNIGCKMLKSMGWTGGGLLGKGIAEPIQATANLSFGKGLGFAESKTPQNSKLFRKRLEAMLREFCKSENYSDLVFSKDFTKEERKEIHQMAGRLHLHTQSRGVGDDRFLTIRQKYETTKLLKFLVHNGGSNSKFELIDNSLQ